MKKTLTKLTLGMVFLASCTYDNREDLADKADPCDTKNLEYATHIVPIIQSNCMPCHKAKASNGVDLASYDQLKKHIDSGRLVGAIKQDPGFAPMPKGRAKLSDCEIKQVERWIKQGAINNQ